MNAKYYPSLDGLRAFAVMLVMLGHAITPRVRSGGIGVDVFFVLSGFLITSLLSAEIERYGRLNLRNFYVRRILRLFPALFVTTALFCIIATLQDRQFPTRTALIAITHTANWARAVFDVHLGLVQHYWSLACEEQYYLIWPLVVLMLERTLRGPDQKALVLIALAVALAVYRYSLADKVDAARIYFALDTHMDGLVLGSALAYLLRGSAREVLSRQGRLLGWVVVPLCGLILAWIMYRMTWRDPWMGRYGYALTAFASAILIADLMAGSHSWQRWPLSLAPAVYVGRISYGIYLLHPLVFYVVALVLPATLPRSVSIPIKIAASIAAAALSYHAYERRFLKLKERFGRGGAVVVGETREGLA